MSTGTLLRPDGNRTTLTVVSSDCFDWVFVDVGPLCGHTRTISVVERSRNASGTIHRTRELFAISESASPFPGRR